MDESSIIGKRVVYEGHLGTVKYTGKVGQTKGQWLGVDWDEPSRGKHNGCHEEKQYFKTVHPHSGSFIRAEKVDLGISICDGIKERYGRAKEKDDNFGICKETLILPQAPGSQDRTIEVIGLKDICETQSDNRLALPKEPEKLVYAFNSVRQLLLHRVNYNWEQILTCMEFIREVNNLMISGNNILYLSSPQLPILEKLNELNFQFNDLSEWNDILKLGELPNLERLDLSNNKLKNIYFSDANSNEKSNFFRNLKVLLLSCNELQSWKDLAELNKLQKFENLTIRKNPITDSYRFQDIAINLFPRIGNLKFHNHSEITDVDRKGSEYEYIRKYAKEWYALQDESSINKFLEEHPRYKHLISAYGLPNPNELEKKDTTLRSNLISILRQLLCVSCFCSVVEESSLSFLCQLISSNDMEIPLDNDLRPLSFYSIETGATLQKIIITVDAPSRECVLAALDFTGWYQNMSKVAITPLLEEIDQVDSILHALSLY
ncbi:Tubulin-specific chaperone E [Nymphon striatum]|nr:Tubulin-specific chaperone E [Nymphon striatum]